MPLVPEQLAPLLTPRGPINYYSYSESKADDPVGLGPVYSVATLGVQLTPSQPGRCSPPPRNGAANLDMM